MPRQELIGTWRAEDDESVTEIAFRADGTYSEWTHSKTELHTPGVIIESGDWRLTDRQLELTPKTTNSVEVSEPTHLSIERLGGDRLVAKPSKGATPVTARRLKLPTCTGKVDPTGAPIAKTLMGNWRVHYRTHDYHETYKSDNTVTISIQIGEEMQVIHEGTWRVDDTTLVLFIAGRGEYRRAIVALGPDCITFTDDGLPYTLERSK